MFIERNGKTIELTDAEVEKIYRMQDKKYMLADAETHFYEKIGYVLYAENTTKNNECIRRFVDKYGFTPDEAVNENSKHYLLEQIVDNYEQRVDCNNAENDTWQYAVEIVLESLIVH